MLDKGFIAISYVLAFHHDSSMSKTAYLGRKRCILTSGFGGSQAKIGKAQVSYSVLTPGEAGGCAGSV